jgi:hypothetical protein
MQNALVTFPKYVCAMKWHYPDNSIVIHNFKMAASKPEIKMILDISHCIIASVLRPLARIAP